MTRVGEVADFVLSAKALVDLVLQSVPQAAPAALPWAGVCLGLQVSSTLSIVLPSFANIRLDAPEPCTSCQIQPCWYRPRHLQMDWYCALTEHLLNGNNISTSSNFQAVLDQLEERVVELYKALLLYQMKTICSYYRTQGLVFLRSILNLDDWDGDLKLVTDAETAVQHDAENRRRLP
ncbi:hypothetical protein F5Y17DRAFT_453334 [Xylariaceae sp. FL0594]|nr:hypothetical protein F5Y17DRAFT_453334 [Xylariaceae sp. FL0594]